MSQKYLYSRRQNSLASDEAADRTGVGKLSPFRPFTYFIFLPGKYFTLFSSKFKKSFILCSAYQKL